MSNNVENRPKNSKGREYRCTLARHLRTLGQQAVWHQIERFAKVSTIENENQGKPNDRQEQPTFYASIATLADACNCSYNTVRQAVAEFVRLGLLTPSDDEFKYTPRKENGRWQTRKFAVATHDHYKEFNPCPNYRFARRNGALVVKDEVRAFGTDMLADNFKKRSPLLETLEQARDVIELRGNGNGLSFGEIGKRLGINKGRACKLYHRYHRIKNQISELIEAAKNEPETVST